MINFAGLELIKEFEGFRSEAYQDAGGVWTVGFGHTAHVKEGDCINEATGVQYLLADCAFAESFIDRSVVIMLTSNQESALISFVFNLGTGNFQNSTLLKLLNKDLIDEAADQFLVWDKERINGELVVVPGLTRRRAAERALFLTV